jgi:hypothetical protein
MNSLSNADLQFERDFASGRVAPTQFDHRAHLRLAYIQLAIHGPHKAVEIFRESLQRFLDHHRIDPRKFHETLTQSWLMAVWLFMQRLGDTANSEDFVAKCHALQDPNVMLTHYSKELLFSDAARERFIAPDLDPIPDDFGLRAGRHD